MIKFNKNLFCERVNSLFGNTGQMELAEKINLSQGVISSIKNKKVKAPGADTVFKIARYFNASTDYLLGIEDGKTHQVTADMEALGLDEECLNIILQAKGTDEQRKIAFLLKNKDKIFDLIERWEK